MKNSAEQPVCDFVVVTFNKLDVTKSFVKSLCNTAGIRVRVIFVDNASSDGTKQYLASLTSTETCAFQVIVNDQNEGFIKGVNRGLAETEAPFICIANNDLTFTNGWLSETIGLLKSRPEIGLLNPNSNNLGNSPPAETTIDEYGRQVASKFKGQFVELTDCIGFCMIFHRKIFQKVGGLSEEFVPMFFEDTDFSRRVRAAGYKIGMAKGAYVWHEEHSSIGQLGSEAQKIFERSREVFLKKWGKTLRIAWVAKNADEVRTILPSAADLVRDGNYVWIYAPRLRKNRDEIFREHKMDELADLKFVSYNSFVDLAWKFLIKKKKYDCAVIGRPFLARVIGLLQKNLFVSCQREAIRSLKSAPSA